MELEPKKRPNSSNNQSNFFDDLILILMWIIVGLSGYRMFIAESSLSPEFLQSFIIIVIVWVWMIGNEVNKLKEKMEEKWKKKQRKKKLNLQK